MAAIKNVGRLGGMDGATVDKCLADNGMVQQINARVTEATDKLKINSTPSFIVNGKLAVGEMNYDAFMKLLPAVN